MGDETARGRWIAWWPMAAIVWGSPLVTPQPVAGLDIVLEFNSGVSENPSFDPSGSKLTDIMQAVETVYEDIFEDAHTLILRYWWEDLDGGTLGVHQGTLHNGQRELRANLRFDTQDSNGVDRAWFMDPTPLEDSEFNIQQDLVADLANPSNSFNGSPPDQLEVGYRGIAPVSSPARNKFDLFTVALHEVGHGLGVPAVNPFDDETDDGDWDTPPQLMGGSSVGVLTAGTSGQGLFHLNETRTLMNPSISTNLREYPTATDVFAMASTADWAQIDLPRKDFLGSGGSSDPWNTASRWIGNRVPDIDDDVYLRHGAKVVTLNATGLAANLTIDAAAQLRTMNHSLTVTGQTRIEGGSRLVVGNLANPAAVPGAAQVTTGSLELGPGGHELTLAGGRLTIGSGSLVIGTGDTLNGQGTISADVSSAGTIAPGLPGLPTGLISVEGDLILQDDSEMEIQLRSTGPDQVSVAGDLTLDGLLTVTLSGGFEPTPGQVFDVLFADQISGGFDDFGGDVFRWSDSSNLALIPLVDEASGVVSLVTTLVGDVNADREVGFVDFLVFQSRFGTAGDWYDGDFNGDEVINFVDFLLVQSTFGQSLVGESAAAAEVTAALTTPEPGSFWAALAASAPFFRRWRG